MIPTLRLMVIRNALWSMAYRFQTSKTFHHNYMCTTIDPEHAFLQLWFELAQVSVPDVHQNGTSTELLREACGSTYSSRTHDVSGNVMQFSKAMLDVCMASHVECRAGDTIPFLPTRLIEVRRIEQAPGGLVVKLIETDSMCRTEPYCTLSHCWGAIEIQRLLNKNLSQMLSSIEFSNLPQTFKDALVVTNELGLTYIWIDSLCIIQDSEHDWKREAARMRDVYRNAIINIAATKATDSRVGLFSGLTNVRKLSANVSLDCGPQLGMFEFFEKNYWERVVNAAPLNLRAWVVQERLLSPRTLHFTREQIIWSVLSKTRLSALI